MPRAGELALHPWGSQVATGGVIVAAGSLVLNATEISADESEAANEQVDGGGTTSSISRRLGLLIKGSKAA